MSFIVRNVSDEVETRRRVEVRPFRNGQAIYVDGQFVSDHYSQDSLAAAHANICKAEGWR